MFEKLRPRLNRIAEPMGRLLVKLGIGPNHITILGFVFSLIAGLFYSMNHYGWGGLFVILAGTMDGLDGTVARLTKKSSKRGAFLDSVFDRLGEAVIFAGIIISLSKPLYQLIGILAMSLSFIISYLRARAESLGLEMRGIGLMERGDRMLFIMAMSIVGYLWPNHEAGFVFMLVLLLVLVMITVIQRFTTLYDGLEAIAEEEKSAEIVEANEVRN